MKVPFWRLVACFFGMHGPVEGVYRSNGHRRSSVLPDKVQCLLCGKVLGFPRH